jgi:hypothetical protein
LLSRPPTEDASRLEEPGLYVWDRRRRVEVAYRESTSKEAKPMCYSYREYRMEEEARRQREEERRRREEQAKKAEKERAKAERELVRA